MIIGMPVLLPGDFRTTLPVVFRGTQADEVSEVTRGLPPVGP